MASKGPKRPLRLRVATPAYRLQCDVRHAAFVMALIEAWNMRSRASEPIEWDTEHSSVLPELRARILYRAIQSEADVLITVDSDTWIRHDRIGDFVHEVISWYRESSSAHAVLGVIVPQRDGRPNAWSSPGERIAAEPVQPTNVFAIGTAVMCHNLDWYRAAGNGAGVYYAMTPSDCGAIGRNGSLPIYTGEDVWHCACVAKFNGIVQAIACGGVHGGAL